MKKKTFLSLSEFEEDRLTDATVDLLKISWKIKFHGLVKSCCQQIKKKKKNNSISKWARLTIWSTCIFSTCGPVRNSEANCRSDKGQNWIYSCSIFFVKLHSLETRRLTEQSLDDHVATWFDLRFSAMFVLVERVRVEWRTTSERREYVAASV